MNGIDNLLEKYFNGITSTEEEKRIRKYFEGSSVLAEHEMYRPLFATFCKEKMVKSPEIAIQVKKVKRYPFSQRVIGLLAGAAAIALLIIGFSTLNRTQRQHQEYVVIMNGKEVINQSEARQYAEQIFRETEKIVESSYQSLREVADIKKDLNAEKILMETDQTIEQIKTNYKQ